MRKDPLINGCLYHICTKSIAGYKIFRSTQDYSRMMEMIKFYSYEKPPVKFSIYHTLEERDEFLRKNLSGKESLILIVAYCLMPTHIHMILVQVKDKGISIYMKNLLDSYTRYFNIKNERKGPLWQGRFKSVLVKKDEQLLHLTRYIHLNPTSENIVQEVNQWPYSSYHEYLGKKEDQLCYFTSYLNMDPEDYRIFVEERRDYQKKLNEIKHLLLE
ncbi:MAG: transposase [Nitrospirae bacterium]|nr:transposase [Nitrospirota bacterium]